MPRTYFGPHGENNSTYAFQTHANLGRWPLGHILELPDHRQYRFVLNDGTVEVAGNLYQSVAPVTGHTNIVADIVRAIGATAISATLNGTAPGADIYTEGIVHINDLVGESYAYRIRRAMTAGAAHASAGSAAVLTVNLEAGETVQVALDTTSAMTLTRNRYHQVLIQQTPPTAGLAGVSPGVAAADRFYWSQVQGYAAVLANGTLLAGLPVMAAITTNGSVESLKRRVRAGGTTLGGVVPTTMVYVRLLDQDGGTTDFLCATTVSTGVTFEADISGPIAINGPAIGMCVKANSTTQYALVDLAIP